MTYALFRHVFEGPLRALSSVWVMADQRTIGSAALALCPHSVIGST